MCVPGGQKRVCMSHTMTLRILQQEQLDPRHDNHKDSMQYVH